jgi:predicted nucleic-acid-binding Zn-ribbon protein
MSQPQSLNYRCPKCSNTACDIGEMRATGGFWSKIFDVQGSRYSAVTCSNCKYTEFFKAPTNLMGNIFDLFTN